jgi:hypothetical protein
MNKKVLWGPNNLHIQLDRNEVFPEDPGKGMPALVILHQGRETYVGSYSCVASEDEVEGVKLNSNQIKWIAQQETEIENFLKGS